MGRQNEADEELPRTRKVMKANCKEKPLISQVKRFYGKFSKIFFRKFFVNFTKFSTEFRTEFPYNGSRKQLKEIRQKFFEIFRRIYAKIQQKFEKFFKKLISQVNLNHCMWLGFQKHDISLFILKIKICREQKLFTEIKFIF